MNDYKWLSDNIEYVDVNDLYEDEQSILMESVRLGFLNIIQLLIQSGCPIDEQDKRGETFYC